MERRIDIDWINKITSGFFNKTYSLLHLLQYLFLLVYMPFLESEDYLDLIHPFP